MAVQNNDQRAPVPNFPERVTNVYEVKLAPNVPMRQGPLLHEEGLIYGDPSLIAGAWEGARDGELTGPGSPQHNPPYHRQSAEQTVSQRARMGGSELHGNAAWTRQDEFLGGFVRGTSPEAEQRYLHVTRSGRPYWRLNEATIHEDSGRAGRGLPVR